ncbi:uncharacterized protein LOC128986815 [Macrosteles quadrilineatus]|uniref:uncharacterized protein LOC128986815 n=1 Tax=Macrosteles quadrilineatus TaxID=74068 RepID=UPI0023E33459|nr:uncharacterized protein LOC128986815 [Macrosteles quadrilineatus]
MELLIFVSLCVAVNSAPHFPLLMGPPMLVAPPYLHYDYGGYQPRPAVFAPQPPRRRVAPATTSPPLVSNTVTFTLDPHADPDDTFEVAQFHSQDAAGRVVFGFNTPDQSRMEARALDGSVRGSYSYQDPTGKTVKMHYWDDGAGFHTVGNNLPASYYASPQYTPEVQAARERHFLLYRQALASAMAQSPGSYEDDDTESAGSSVSEDSTDASVSKPESTSSPANQEADDSQGENVEDDSDSAENGSVTIENPDFSPLRIKAAERKGEAEADRKQVAQLPVTDLHLDHSSGLAIARTGLDGFQYLVPIPDPAQSLSESHHASLYGAIPVAAVHDTQVSPSQRNSQLDDHQVKPVLIRTAPIIAY